jgi:hypothetical protein
VHEKSRLGIVLRSQRKNDALINFSIADQLFLSLNPVRFLPDLQVFRASISFRERPLLL